MCSWLRGSCDVDENDIEMIIDAASSFFGRGKVFGRSENEFKVYMEMLASNVKVPVQTTCNDELVKLLLIYFVLSNLSLFRIIIILRL